eukprot:COSAG06_NODE_27728_length_587_cov_1.157787_1_plen_29_part_01
MGTASHLSAGSVRRAVLGAIQAIHMVAVL